MASGDYYWPLVTTAGSSSYTWNGGGSYTLSLPPVTYTSGYSTNPPPRDPTVLEWLDSEVEKVCKLARAVA